MWQEDFWRSREGAKKSLAVARESKIAHNVSIETIE
jgi:hypothetical protein